MGKLELVATSCEPHASTVATFGGSGNARTSDPGIAALERIVGGPAGFGEHSRSDGDAGDVY